MSQTPQLLLVSDLRAQVAALRPELDAAISRVLTRGWFVLGEECAEFELEFANHLGARYAVGVANGTDAIHLALRALDVGQGDRVLTAPNSAVPTACGIVQSGAVPCFADVDLEYGLLDPSSVERELDSPDGSSIRAIVAVHLYGRTAPMGPLLELAKARGIPVIEDAAQAHGASRNGQNAGTIGDLACWSFYPSKNLGALGDGGAVSGMRPELEARLRHLRNYGQEDRYHHVELGFNSRLDEIQAAVLRVKLAHLDAWNARRRAIAGQYREAFADLPLLTAREDTDAPSVEHLFVVRVANRDRLRAELEARGIGTQVHYPIPIHLQPAYRYLGIGAGRFPSAELRAGQIVSLPLYPEMRRRDVERVIDAVRDSLQGEPHPEEVSV
ncbi:MAG: DegT/DnrJ/EryC1/StrS family aminotransferase [Candidatus Eisenbacteria bacterium]|uniref:DegT/DnrJ/EryC1/StrS family aminotransferase n=1 Tax=Eiseniibacteriota bacterium TaxID=2212470 RepID=A0A956SCZ5_UNCEI|nr:DegT/DnrJ/EryC1/StrS family aminotransferase [Candidatus Eisenbacteria bacterium]MCB9463146.1 DegT/DnrJ/EryC1/StrS family aminotransferase [Candidatus Eisenbacteria bacterium]